MMFCHGQCNNFKKELLTIEMIFVWYRKTLLLFSIIPKKIIQWLKISQVESIYFLSNQVASFWHTIRKYTSVWSLPRFCSKVLPRNRSGIGLLPLVQKLMFSQEVLNTLSIRVYKLKQQKQVTGRNAGGPWPCLQKPHVSNTPQEDQFLKRVLALNQILTIKT